MQTWSPYHGLNTHFQVPSSPWPSRLARAFSEEPAQSSGRPSRESVGRMSVDEQSAVSVSSAMPHHLTGPIVEEEATPAGILYHALPWATSLFTDVYATAYKQKLSSGANIPYGCLQSIWKVSVYQCLPGTNSPARLLPCIVHACTCCLYLTVERWAGFHKQMACISKST